MTLSIIIPLYNLESLVGGCIASALAQDLPAEAFEVIVVDDGSTDGSLAAARLAAAGHPNVRIFARENAGVGEARNFGVKQAAGRCVVFLDADDTLEPGMLGRIADRMRQDELDMLCVRVRAVDEDGRVVPYWSDREYDRRAACTGSGCDFLRDEFVLPMVCAYVCDREFLIGNDLWMRPIRHEDEEFVPRALYRAGRIGYLPEPFYRYLQRSDSYMGSYRPEQVFHMVEAMQSLEAFARSVEAEGDPKGARLIRNRIGLATFRYCRRTVLQRFGNTRELIARLRDAGVFPLRFARPQFRYRLLNHSSTLFILLYRLHRRH